jgi:transcriptional regulator GlxA family with amidase domain
MEDTTRFGFFVFDGAEELDWVGPWEVLAAWSQGWPEDRIETITFSRDEGPITCAKGLRFIPDYTWETVPDFDVLIYPGGRGTRQHLGDEDIHRWLDGLAGDGTLMTSVCTGSLVFADAGLLDGAPATTHWENLDQLAKLGADIEVRSDDRFVDNGSIVTSAGVSAGLDMALHLVARLHSPERARAVRRSIQYDPEPPV